MSWYVYLLASLAFSLVGLLFLQLPTRTQQWHGSFFNPEIAERQPAVARLQHRRQLHQQHQLAELRRRDDDELSDADGRRSPSRTSSRPPPASRWPLRWSAASRGGARSIGNFWVDLIACTLYILLPICVRRRAVPRLAGRAAELRRLHARAHAPRAPTQTIAQGPVASQEAIKHARHQRRRLLQRQLGAPVREPDAALELHRDALDLR